MHHFNDYYASEAYYLASLVGYFPNDSLTSESENLKATSASQPSERPSHREKTAKEISLTTILIAAVLLLSSLSIYLAQQQLANRTIAQANTTTQQLVKPIVWKF